MAYLTPLPVGLDKHEWAARFREAHPKQVPLLQGEDWVSWGQRVISAPTFLRYSLPNPVGFSAFEDWALAVLRAAPGI